MKRRLVSLLLTIVLVFSIFTSSFTITASAGFGVTVKTFGMNKVIDFGYRSIAKMTNKALNATGNVTGVEQINKVASIINTVLMGSTGKSLGEIKSLCNDILNEVKSMHEDMEASFSIVEQMLGQQAASTARNKQDEKWNSDVMSVINEYNAEPALEQYLEYMKAAVDYSDDKTNTDAKEKYEQEKEQLIQTFRLMYHGEISVDVLSDPDKLQDVLFTSTTIDDSFINMISKLSANLVKGQNSSNITLAETAAMTANEYFPFSHQQYQFIHTVVGEQLMELTMCMFVASEFFDVQGEYILNKYGEGSPNHIGYLNVVNQYYDMITGGENSVENRINEMLDAKMVIDKYTSKSLMDYMQPEDAVSVNMKIEDFEKSHHFQSMDNSVYVDKKYINDKVKFNRVMVNDTIYYIIDKDQFSDKLALSTSALEYKDDNGVMSFDVHLPSVDYLNLIKNMSDGANTFKVSGKDTSVYNGLIATNSFALAGNIPEKYLEGYFPNDGTGDSIIITSENEYHVNISMFHTQYAKYEVIDAKDSHSTGTLKTKETSAEHLQSPNGDNQRYSVILAQQSEFYQQNLGLEANALGIESAQLVTADNEGNEIIIDNNETKKISSGVNLAINVKLNDRFTVSSIKCVRDNDLYSSSGTAESDIIASADEFSTINPNEDGSYTINYSVPYSDAKIIIQTEEKDDCVYNENGFCVNCGGYQPAVQNENGTYEISNAGQLFWFASLVNNDREHAEFEKQCNSANAVLTANIDLENREWKPISNYSGNFDGNNYTILALKITKTTSNSGLFGNVSGEIKNITVKGDVSLSSDGSNIGGVVGAADGAVIYNVSSFVNISNDDCELKHIGGIIGGIETNETTVDKCIYYGSMNIANSIDCIGGIVGYTNKGGRINNCANVGNITTSKSAAFTGGILGYVNNTFATVKNCYNYGTVSNGNDKTRCGAIIGYAKVFGSVTNNYYLDSSASIAYGSDSISGAEAILKTSDEFKSGEVAFLLNGEKTDGTQAWYQDLDNGQIPNDYPMFAGGTVYYGLSCHHFEKIYSNYLVPHEFDDNGFCENCGAYQPATLNQDNIYEIRNGGQLFWFASLVNGDKTHAYFEEQNSSANGYLKNDIHLDNREWTPIMNYSGEFGGDENWQTISGLNITTAGQNVGLFGIVSGMLSNFKVEGNITTSAKSQFVGGVAGTCDGAEIFNVISDVDIKCPVAECVGGIVGIMQNSGRTYKCMYTGNLDVTYSLFGLGGIAGTANLYDSSDTVISNCANVGNISGATDNMLTGGIAGLLDERTKLINCYNYGNVSVCNGDDADYCGAVAGVATLESKELINNNYYREGSASDAFGKQSMAAANGTSFGISKTADEFASGEVAYLLNSNEAYPDILHYWYQNIDNGKTPDYYPKFEGGTVYYLSSVDTYSNFESVSPTEPATEPTTQPSGNTDEFDKDPDGNLIIKTYDDIVKLSQLVRSDYDIYGSQNYILTNNIKADDSAVWTQGIGSFADNKPFNGTFDGNGYCIIGLNVNAPEYGGLFEIIGESGCVKNLLVFDCEYTASSKTAGGIAAVNDGTIDHCISGVNLTTGVIHFPNRTIDAAELNSKIKGDASGGIVGENNGLITGCRNASVVSGTQCGGIACVNTGKIYGCANNAKIGTSNSSASGGLVGKNGGIIESSYNSGSVNGKSENAKGAIAGINGYDKLTPAITNVFYLTVNGLNAVGADSAKIPDDTNIGMSKSSDFQSSSFVDRLNEVSDDSVVWVHNSYLNKGYPTIKCNFLKISVKPAGNNITVKGCMHENLNIKYDACGENDNEYSLLSSSIGENKILKVYSVSMTDNNGNYIPAELWCQGEFEISFPVDNNNVQFAAMDTDGKITYYEPDSVENGIAVFTVSHPTSFAVVETAKKNISADTDTSVVRTTNDGTPIQTGTEMCCGAILLVAVLSFVLIFSVRRRNRIE